MVAEQSHTLASFLKEDKPLGGHAANHVLRLILNGEA